MGISVLGAQQAHHSGEDPESERAGDDQFRLPRAPGITVSVCYPSYATDLPHFREIRNVALAAELNNEKPSGDNNLNY